MIECHIYQENYIIISVLESVRQTSSNGHGSYINSP